MKKNLAKKITLSILAGAVLMSSSVVWARDFTNVAPPNTDYWVGIDIDLVPNTIEHYAPGTNSNSSDPSASNNKVVFNSGFSGTVNVSFAGGYSDSVAVESNTVTIGGGVFDGNTSSVVIYGGYAKGSGNAGDVAANGNKVTINGGTFTSVDVYGGYSVNGNATHNEVVISGVVINSEFGDIYGGYSVNDGDVTGNTVNISGGTFSSVYGGRSTGGSATGNTVNISDGTFTGYVSGGNTGGDAEDNTVTISGGEIKGDVYGGSAGGNAEGNTVTISDGTFGDGNAGVGVYGGYSSYGNAKGNTVNIGGTADLSYANLYGGHLGNNSNGTSSDNVLNVGYDEGVDDGGGKSSPSGYKSWTNGSKVKSIQNFQKINFKNINWSDGGTVLKVDGEAKLDATEIEKISIICGTVTNGEYMNLISAGTLSGTYNGESDKDIKVYTVSEIKTIKGDISVDNNNVKLTIDDTTIDSAGINADEYDDNNGGGNQQQGSTGGVDGGTGVPGSSELNPQVLVIGESRTAATAFTNQGSELIETGLDALARDNSKDTKVFAAVYGNHSEYETGSHVNVNGWSGIVGVGKTNANGLTVGAFFENGDGNYSTHNVTDFGYLRGDGEAVYNGGGLLVRKDNASGVYTEASLRAGNLKNELRGAVIGSQGEMGYDIDTFYYGAHIGVGKIIARGADGDSLDVYGKFIYTHHDGEDFEIDGDEFKFDSVDSERLRVGFRLNEVNGSKATMYYGAAWEYEFGGDADNKVVGYDLSTPSLEGSTVIGEVGMHYKASEKWSLDLNARAYTGQREGFSGSVQANYSF